ncbi:uncharacterized protein LOC133303422 [Gastrolobium bilobum]|uniref:uncharacterized protein LOC133303422 n=1 Tax=Gastrolobium bilobum TaxID=150636 RepID=UPI002AB22CA2|nr:uncharacterized protein LOC133303422 [Gastrolobium bilobum]
MAASDQDGRNISQEVDEVRERMNTMEELLRAMAVSISMLGANGAAGNAQQHSTTQPGDAQGNNGMGNANGQPHIGEGYQSVEDANAEVHGQAGQNGQATGTQFGNGRVSDQKDKVKDGWMEKMEEKIKAIQGPSAYGSLGVEELCSATDVIIPKDFKVPDFSKYDGSTNPIIHLKTYCTKMAIWSKDENFLVSFFHESLAGPALEWYIQMDHSKIGCWKDLADAFMNQYRFNLDTAPTREQLAALQKENKETFKQYAQRWRALAAQVQPPLTLSEMCSYFLGTLGAPYVGSMAGAAYRDFADLIAAGERIEILAKAGKLPMDYRQSSPPKKGLQPKKRESEVNHVRHQQSFMPRHPTPNPSHQILSYNPFPFTSYQTPTQNFPNLNAAPTPQFQVNNIPMTPRYAPTRPSYAPHPTRPQYRPNHTQPHQNSQNQSLPPFPKLSISNADLFQRLFDAHLISESPVRPMQPPFPAWYNPNSTCRYHMGVAGHSIEDCEAFKTAVRKLIACGRLDIQEETGPNIVNNPIPNHGGKNQVNAVEIENAVIKKVLSLHTPMSDIWEGLKKAGYDITVPGCSMKDEEKYDIESSCAYHSGHVGHDTENCWDFKVRVQGLITLGVIQARRKDTFSEEVSVVERFILRVPPLNQNPLPEKMVMKVKKPAPFPYDDTHAIPWNYKTSVEEIGSASRAHTDNPHLEEESTDAIRVGEITRSGRFYGPKEPEKRKSNKEDEAEEIIASEMKGKGEEDELLKIMKQSEYDVMEQLKKTPARISLLSLILSSESHRKALMSMLSEAYVKSDVTPENVVNMVDPVKHVNMITFSIDEIVCPYEKTSRALHITLKCRGYIIAKVLIDGGSALNVLPLSTLSQLSMSTNDLTPQEMIVRAFDGTKRGILGEIVLPLEIGPSNFQVLFQTMDIEPAYTMLLGRPWIHAAGAVPSTLHQKVKYIENETIVTIHGEEEIMVSKPVSVPYVENTDSVEGNGLHSFEVVESSCKKDASLGQSVNEIIARIMAKSGYKVGKGLGSQLQGSRSPVMIPEKSNRFGLGYEGSFEEEVGSMSLGKRGKKGKTQQIPHLRETFPVPAEIIMPEEIVHLPCRLHINALDDEDLGGCSTIRPSTNDEALKNWQTEPVIDVIAIKNLDLIETLPHERDLENSPIDPFMAINEEDPESDEEQIVEKLSKLLEGSEKEFDLNDEAFELINMGTEEEKKELKIVDNPEREEMIQLFKEYLDVFAWTYRDMPGVDPRIASHKIPLYPDAEPKKQKLRRMRPDISLKIKEEVTKLLEAEFIEVSIYPDWVANVVPVPKKDGKIRVCVDYRDLNKACPKDDFPLPHIDVLVDNTAKYHTFSFMDGYSGYNQILMDVDDKEKTAFITPWGTFRYRVMSFGLKNAGATYQRAMVALFHDMMHKEIEVYVDDIVAKSREGESHVTVLQKLFERLRKYKLRLNPSKCVFGASSGKLLGFIVSREGIQVDPEKAKAIRDMPAPKSERDVRSFLGRLNYIARFIANLTSTCEPIFKLLRKNQPGKWDEDCQKAFDRIKAYLLNPPILVPPTPGRPLILYLTVLPTSMGAMLGQRDESDRKEQAVYYISKKFNECEVRYMAIEKTCSALVWSSKRLRQYMLYYTTWLISRIDPLKYIFESPHISLKVSKWQMILSEFDIQYVTRNHLAENPLEDDQSMQIEIPGGEILAVEEDEIEESAWKMYFDGAVNMHGSGVGAVVISPTGKQYPVAIKLGFECTNNIAEYEACASGLRLAIDLGVKQLEVFGDAALIIYQVNGEWQTKDVKLVPYQKYLTRLIAEFEEIEFSHLTRDKNRFADALATLAAMTKLDIHSDVQPIQVEKRDEPSYCASVEEGPDEYPTGANETHRKTVRRLSMAFFLNGEVLYKRSHDGTLLRCVDAREAHSIMIDVHEGICGTHANGHMMTRKIMRSGYYWSTMEADCVGYVRKCQKCQMYADRINSPPFPLHNMVSPWPFSMWGIDVIGLINPKASNGHRFILVAIDYFTKWIEASSYANISQKVFVKFLKRDIICRYGVPERIITDNAPNLNGAEVQKLCGHFKIKHHNSAPYRPQMNGAVEAANKNIKKIIAKMVVSYKDWHEMLPYALHAYRTNIRTSTGETPFSLVYGMEAVSPIEVEIPSLRVLMEAELEESEWVKARYEQLNMIEEKRLTALCHGQLYQSRMAKAFKKKVRPREFRSGDLVLKKIFPNQEDARGKWAPNYDGPYVVKHAFSGGALILQDMEGQELRRPINTDAVKRFYA